MQTKNVQLNKTINEKEDSIKEVTSDLEVQKVEVLRLGKLNEELRKDKERALTHFGAEENKSKYKDQRIEHLMKEVSDL